MPRLREVIESQVMRGDGKRVPTRYVTEIHDTHGELLAIGDPAQEHEDAFIAKLLDDVVEACRDTERKELALRALTARHLLAFRPLGDPAQATT